MKMLCHFVVFLIFVGLVSFVEPKFIILSWFDLKNLESLYFLVLFFFFYNTMYFNTHTHTQGEKGKCFKETNNSVYLKGPN